jgi:hypothetical protein
MGRIERAKHLVDVMERVLEGVQIVEARAGHPVGSDRNARQQLGGMVRSVEQTQRLDNADDVEVISRSPDRRRQEDDRRR